MKKIRYSKEEVRQYYKDMEKFLKTKYKEGLKEILHSHRFQEMLRVKNLAYNYSLYNTMLIIAQKPEILENGQLVLPKYKWEKLGRQVKKDAQPIWIWRPNPKKIYDYKKEPLPLALREYYEMARNSKTPQEFVKKVNEMIAQKWEKSRERLMDEIGIIDKYYGNYKDEKILAQMFYDAKRGYITKRVEKGEKLYFKPEKVYAQEDTEGRELPDMHFKTLKGNDYKKFYEMIRDSSPIPVEEIYGYNLPYHGKYSPEEGKITIVRSNYNSMLATLIHELGHAIRHKEGMMTNDRNLEEAVVESTSISLLTRMGVKEAVQYRGEYVLHFLNAQKEEDLDKAGHTLFKETTRTTRKLLEKVPAIQHAISEVDRQRIEYEAKLMKEAQKETQEEIPAQKQQMEVEV